MEVLVVICIGLMTGLTEAQLIRSNVTIPVSTADQTAKFSLTLQCQSGSSVYVTAISYTHADTSCCPSLQPQCLIYASPSDVGDVSPACRTSPNCTVEFSAPPGNCIPINAFINFICAPDKPSLVINRESSATGSLITAAFSIAQAPASGDSALWVCSVEALDCSGVNVTLLLVIRNGNDTTSHFSVAGATLGVKGVAWSQTRLQTPFAVVLKVIPGSALLYAYFAVPAGSNVTTTCGRRPTPVPTSFNNVSIVSTPPTRISGQELTAVHSSSGVETAGDWVCVVETADCSTDTPVQVSFYVSNRPCGNTSYFSLNSSKVESGSTVTATTPLEVTLRLVEGSRVGLAFFSVAAGSNVTTTCGRRPTPVPTTSNNVSIVSTPPTRISGQELTAVHSSSGVETAGDWVCVVERADCSTDTPVQVSFYVSNRPCGNTSYFSLNSSKVESGSTVTVTTSLEVTLRLVEGSRVGLAYFSVTAQKNLTVGCGRNASSPPQAVQYQCAACQSRPCQGVATCVPSPGSFECVCPGGFSSSSSGLSCRDVNECTAQPPSCDVTAHCNNTEGSFHCYCDPGFHLMDNMRGCQNSSIPMHQPLTAPVDVVVAGSLGGLALLILVIVAVVVIVRLSKKRTSGEAHMKAAGNAKTSGHNVHVNNAYEEITLPEVRHGNAYSETPTTNPADHQSNNAGAAIAVTSENDTAYDVLGQKRPPADARSSGSYGRLQDNAA